MNKHVRKYLNRALTKGQKALKKKHGTPAQFAQACFECVPGWISMDEAIAVVAKYRKEWEGAK